MGSHQHAGRMLCKPGPRGGLGEALVHHIDQQGIKPIGGKMRASGCRPRPKSWAVSRGEVAITHEERKYRQGLRPAPGGGIHL